MRPARERFRQSDQTYFVTFQTARRQCFFRNDRWAKLLLGTFEKYESEFALHDFVIMPDHVHLLVSPSGPLERTVQLIKGSFSFSARRAFEWKGDIWQPGFSDHRIRDEDDWNKHLAYIEKNMLELRREVYPFCGKHSHLALERSPPRLKSLADSVGVGGAEAPPLQTEVQEVGAESQGETKGFSPGERCIGT